LTGKVPSRYYNVLSATGSGFMTKLVSIYGTTSGSPVKLGVWDVRLGLSDCEAVQYVVGVSRYGARATTNFEWRYWDQVVPMTRISRVTKRSKV
jgi:hypothetical protein